jgi:hypothetical protein
MNRRAFFAALAAAVVAPKAAKPRVISEEELTERYFRPAVEASIRQFEQRIIEYCALPRQFVYNPRVFLLSRPAEPIEWSIQQDPERW